MTLQSTLTAPPRTARATTPRPLADGSGPIHQLRIYRLREQTKAAFHARFRDHVVRLMQRHGFEIAAMWEADDSGRAEFVYIVEWPDRATMDDGWAKFMSDPEWEDIKARTAAEHGEMVGSIEDRVLRLTAYSRPLRSSS